MDHEYKQIKKLKREFEIWLNSQYHYYEYLYIEDIKISLTTVIEFSNKENKVILFFYKEDLTKFYWAPWSSSRIDKHDIVKCAYILNKILP